MSRASTTSGRQGRGEQTRAAIIEAALGLFSERGFDATTMRAIAQKAGVSLGNAYYYFDSKEQLIQGFYDHAAALHTSRLPEALSGLEDFGERLAAHLDLWLDLMAPHQPFAVAFFRNAADPTSPLSPFSAESGPARAAAIATLQQVIDGSTVKASKVVLAELPELLWLYHMGLVLFWVYDRSEGSAATRLLMRRTVPMVERAIELSRLPVLRATIHDLVGLVGELRELLAPPAGASQTNGQG